MSKKVKHAVAARKQCKRRGGQSAMFLLIVLLCFAVLFFISITKLLRISDNAWNAIITVKTDASYEMEERHQEISKTKTIMTTIKQQTPTSREIVPDWMRAHIEFQQKWIGREERFHHGFSTLPWYFVKENYNNQTRPNLLVWNCPAQGHCGGLGDRLYGMIMGLYIAMFTGRIYLIQEWNHPNIPHPLSDYVRPNHLPWQVNLASETVRQMGMLSTMDNREHELLLDPCGLKADRNDYFLRNNIMTYESKLNQSICFEKYWNKHGGRIDGVPLSNIGFWTLFQFTNRVQEEAQNLLRQSRIMSRYHDHSVVTKTIKPMYMAMHVRTGQGKTWDDPERHAGIQTLERFDECAVRLQTAVMNKCATQPDIYVASDNGQAKAFFLDRHSHDGTFKANIKMEVFHIDRTKTELLSNILGAYEQVWGELKLLVDAACLVMSHSKFSTLAFELSPQQPRCAVYFDECDEERILRALEALSC